MAKFRDKSAQDADRYKHEKADIQDEARKLEGEVAMERKRADRYDLAEVFLEIGLVITSITLLSGRRIFWHLGIVFSVLGVAAAITGAVIH
jgi:ABC-type proline/glycine betaine transport system ATPase subunit